MVLNLLVVGEKVKITTGPGCLGITWNNLEWTRNGLELDNIDI